MKIIAVILALTLTLSSAQAGWGVKSGPQIQAPSKVRSGGNYGLQIQSAGTGYGGYKGGWAQNPQIQSGHTASKGGFVRTGNLQNQKGGFVRTGGNLQVQSSGGNYKGGFVRTGGMPQIQHSGSYKGGLVRTGGNYKGGLQVQSGHTGYKGGLVRTGGNYKGGLVRTSGSFRGLQVQNPQIQSGLKGALVESGWKNQVQAGKGGFMQGGGAAIQQTDFLAADAGMIADDTGIIAGDEMMAVEDDPYALGGEVYAEDAGMIPATAPNTGMADSAIPLADRTIPAGDLPTGDLTTGGDEWAADYE